MNFIQRQLNAEDKKKKTPEAEEAGETGEAAFQPIQDVEETPKTTGKDKEIQEVCQICFDKFTDKGYRKKVYCTEAEEAKAAFQAAFRAAVDATSIPFRRVMDKEKKTPKDDDFELSEAEKAEEAAFQAGEVEKHKRDRGLAFEAAKAKAAFQASFSAAAHAASTFQADKDKETPPVSEEFPIPEDNDLSNLNILQVLNYLEYPHAIERFFVKRKHLCKIYGSIKTTSGKYLENNGMYITIKYEGIRRWKTKWGLDALDFCAIWCSNRYPVKSRWEPVADFPPRST